MRLGRKCAVITGGGRGIGWECARRFAAESALALIADIQREMVEKATHDVRGAGGKAYADTVDVSAPGPIDTGITKFGPDRKRRYLERLPRGRFGLAGDVAGLAVFLASDDAAYITGSIVNGDGGFNSAGPIFGMDELPSLKSDARYPERKG